MRLTIGYYTQTTSEEPPGTWKQCGAFQRHYKMVRYLVKKKLTTEEVNNFLDTDNTKRTAWKWAADRGKSETLQKLWEYAKEKLTEDEFKVLLLNTDIKERCLNNFY